MRSRAAPTGRLAAARQPDLAPTSTAPAGCPIRSPRRSAAQSNNINTSARTAATSRASSGRTPTRPGPERRAARDPARLPGADDDPDLPRRLKDNDADAVLREPARPRDRERHPARRSTPSTRTPTPGTSLLLWRHKGGLYTVSEHLAPPLDYRKVVAYLKRELALARADHAVALDVSPTRREVLAGAAAGALGAAGVYELVDQLAGSAAAAPGGAAPRRPSSTCSRGSGSSRENGVEVLVPPLHHEVVTGEARRSTARELARRAGDARAGARRARRRLRPLARRARRHRRLGAPVLPPLRPGRRRAATCPLDRRAGKPALLDARTLPERPARHRARGERRRDPAAQRRCARTSTTRSTRIERSGRLPRHEPAPRLRRRRLRRRRLAAAADGDRGQRARAPS